MNCCRGRAKRATGLSLPEAGRIVSAVMTALAAWGLFELVRRRERSPRGSAGRCRIRRPPTHHPLWAGLSARRVDARSHRGGPGMLGSLIEPAADGTGCLAGWSLLAVGFAIKITAGFLLIPLVLVIVRNRRSLEMVAAGSTAAAGDCCGIFGPNHLIEAGGGSRAAGRQPVDLARVARGPRRSSSRHTLRFVGWTLFVRAFTPLGAGLALVGLWKRRQGGGGRDHLWSVWGISALAAMALLAEKLHHEYYWLPLAPVVAVGIAPLLNGSPANAGLLRSPSAWPRRLLVPVRFPGPLHLANAGRVDRPRCGGSDGLGIVPHDAWVAGSRGAVCSRPTAAAAGWNGRARRPAGPPENGRCSPRSNSPLELIEYYRSQGARYFADLGSRER